MTSINLATYSPDADFVGYATDGGSTRPVTCSPTLSWTTSNNYAACASTTGTADIATGCYDGSLVYSDGYQTCATAGSTCEAIRIYNKEGDSAPLWTQYNCVHNWNAFSVYRTLTDTSTSTSIPNTATITSAPTASTGSTVYPVSNSSSHSGLSGGAIAGIAIGGAAVILIVLCLIFRRRLLACCGYTRAPKQEPTYAPVLPMQAAEPRNPEPRSPAPYNAPYSPVSLSTDSRRVSQAQSPPPGWDKPELSATSGPYQTELAAFNDPVQPELPAYSRPVGPPRANAHEME